MACLANHALARFAYCAMFTVFLVAACLQQLSDMSQLVSSLQVLSTLQLYGVSSGKTAEAGVATGRCN